MNAPPRADGFASELPFPLDGFQKEAIEAVDQDESVLLAAPTGAGKTVVAEFACWLAIRAGSKCFYTTPLKALSNQKFGDLVATYGAERVGLLTGDNSINGEAPLVVMTTEVLRNMLYEGSPTLHGLRWVVMDEVHYLQDPYRGAVWEEILIQLPEPIRVICLSATVSNADEFGGWLTELRGPTRIVVERERPVELRNLVMVGEELHPLLGEDPNRPDDVNPRLARAWAKGEAAAARYGHRAGQRRNRPSDRVYTPNHVEITEVLDREKMLPAICFIFSRAGCDRAVEACITSDLRLTNAEEEERAREYALMRAEQIPDEDLRALRFGTFLEGLKRGISSHHAGMLPIFKETVEELFAAGIVKMVFATETLSLGINMPARTVVIERLTKFTGERHELLTPLDYTQLTGRAGRRGIDEVGYGIVLYSPWVPLEKVASLATRRDYELSSSFRPSYNMAVNLVANHSEETAYHMLNSSFAQYVTDRDVVRWERRLARKEKDVKEARTKAACELGDVFTYFDLRERAHEAVTARRGSEDVREVFARLAPGDVIWGGMLGKAVVCEQPRRSKKSKEPHVTVMTADRKLRKVGPRDFRVPPEPVGKVRIRGNSWRSAKVRRGIAKDLASLDAERPPKPASPKKAKQLVASYEDHPVHSCPDASEHLAWAERLRAAEEDGEKLRKRVRRRKDTLARTFERVLNVLRNLDYIADWSLTEKGELLRRVYNESDLLVVECLSRGWLLGLDAEELAAVASLFVYESRGRDEPESAPTPHLSRYERRIANLSRSLAEAEGREGLELVREPDAGFMAPCYEWSRGASLETVLTDRSLSPGDFVRNAKQVLDLLQQLKEVTDGPLEQTLREAVKTMQRGVVAYSSVV